MMKMYQYASGRYRLPHRCYNENCYEVNSKHSKAPKRILAKGSAKDGINDDEAAVLREERSQGELRKSAKQ